jgi:hypothetical protein
MRELWVVRILSMSARPSKTKQTVLPHSLVTLLLALPASSFSHPAVARADVTRPRSQAALHTDREYVGAQRDVSLTLL